MNKAVFMTVLFLGLIPILGAQPWVYDFGTATGSFVTVGSSTSFLPDAPQGNDLVWVRDISSGAGLYLENPGLALLGSGSELRIKAPATTNLNKFSLYDCLQSKSAYVQFDVLMGNNTGGYANSGIFYFLLGTGSYFSSSGGFYSGFVFSGIKWTYAANGVVSTEYYNQNAWAPLGTNPFSQSNVYRVEIYANNTTTSDSYSKNGVTYDVAANKQDVWIDGVLIGNDLAKAQLANDSTIDSFMFYGLSSTGIVANLFLDNIVYSNSLPTYPATQASSINLSNVSDSQMTVNWTAGSGDKRIVIVGTSESIIDPMDGTDPAADAAFNAKGQQVVYNGTGSSVTVTNLSAGTNYWIKVYEVAGSGVATRYNISTDSGNYTDLYSQTLPVELSSFTAQVNPLGKIQLSWVTQSETNVHGFYVLRALDNLPASAALVSPLIDATNTSTMQVYQYIDEAIWEAGSYYYWLQSLDLDGLSNLHGPVICNFNPGGQNHNPSIPLQSGLRGIYPNPFNPSTTISYELKDAGNIAFHVYNIKGQMLRQYGTSHSQPGRYSWHWDGCDASGIKCPSGVYSIVLVEQGKRHIRKAVLMK